MSTVKDVARHAGVSIGTVDRVIHGRGRVAEETEQRVMAAIAALDYQPNLHARNLSQSKTFLFDVMTPAPEQDGGYWRIPLNGVQRAIGRLTLSNVEVRRRCFDRHDEASFRAAVRRFAAGAEEPSDRVDGSVRDVTAPAQADGLLVAPVVSRESQSDLLSAIADLGIPAVSFDSRFVDRGAGDRRIPFVGQDPYQGGAVAGRLSSMLVRSPAGTVASVTLGRADEHLLRRASGFHDFWQRFPDVQRAEIVLSDRSEKEYLRGVKNKLRPLLSELSALFVTNAASELVVSALRELDVECHIPLVGYDLLSRNMDLIRSGEIDAIISQKPELQGYEAASALAHHVVFEKQLPGEILMPIEIVLAENLDSFIAAEVT